VETSGPCSIDQCSQQSMHPEWSAPRGSQTGHKCIKDWYPVELHRLPRPVWAMRDRNEDQHPLIGLSNHWNQVIHTAYFSEPDSRLTVFFLRNSLLEGGATRSKNIRRRACHICVNDMCQKHDCLVHRILETKSSATGSLVPHNFEMKI
jgi:hypothetical protein